MDELIGLLILGLLWGLLEVLILDLIPGKCLRKREQHVERAWSDLSSLTGLSVKSGDLALWKMDNQQPQLTGIFRGRGISLIKVIGSGYEGGPYAFIAIKMSVNNTGCVSLSVKEAGFLAKKFKKNTIVSGDKDFDRIFIVTGSPDLFVRRAQALIVFRKSLILNRLNRLKRWILMTNNPFSNMTSSLELESIELKGSVLVCRQHGILMDNQKQIAFLNLLCALAELAEQMGSHNGSYSQTTINHSGNYRMEQVR